MHNKALRFDASLIPFFITLIKVKVGNDQEMAQSERNSDSKNRGGKKLNQQSGTFTKKTYCKPSEQLFPNRWPLSYPNLTKRLLL